MDGADLHIQLLQEKLRECKEQLLRSEMRRTSTGIRLHDGGIEAALHLADMPKPKVR